MTDYYKVHELGGWDPEMWGIFDPLDQRADFWSTKEEADEKCARMNAERLESI